MTNKNEGNIYLIFLDINMPVMNGWEFLEYLTRESVAHVNVIMVSSSVNSSDLDKAKQFKEVVDFWEKPVTHVSFRNFMKSPLFETIKGSLNMT
jgi:CheY-like chemotaxis protein